jgi:RNA polymerase sigma-70 factor, ECF subfamily
MICEEAFPEDCWAENNSVTAERKAEGGTINEVAFRAFYEKMAKPLRSYLLRVSGDSGLADDLLQESFYRFLRAPGLPHDENQMKAYLFKIATHLMTDHWRKTRRERHWLLGTGSNEVERAEMISSVDLCGEVILSHDISQIFRKLRPLERALLWLAYVEEAHHSEIAEALQIREKSVRVVLYRARQRLEALLRQVGLGPEVKL